jgi:6,7-dimethyl-8-ribityllumazine synthase
MKAKVPVIFGVLTVENVEQALERLSHGAAYAEAAIEMATLYKQLDART